MSDVKLNVKKFKEIIEKGTMAHSIECLQLHFVDERVKVNMVSNQRDIVIMLDFKNDIIEFSREDDITFNFAEPQVQIIPYFDIIDDAEAQIEILDENDSFLVKSAEQTSKVRFCQLAGIQNNVLYKSPKDDFSYFTSIGIDYDLLKIFDKIKRIAARFGKLYITVKTGNLFIEVTDKTNRFAPTTDFQRIAEGVEADDLTLCYDFKNFVNLTRIVEDEMAKENGKTFKMSFAYIPETDGGLIHVVSQDANVMSETPATEQYMLLNRGE